MDCKEVNKMIPDFLENKLDHRELRKFMEHILRCEDCKEELCIQFLVLEGMARLETGSTFDLQHELDKVLEDARRKMRIRRIFHYFIYGIEVLAIILIVSIAVWIMM